MIDGVSRKIFQTLDGIVLTANAGADQRNVAEQRHLFTVHLGPFLEQSTKHDRLTVLDTDVREDLMRSPDQQFCRSLYRWTDGG